MKKNNSLFKTSVFKRFQLALLTLFFSSSSLFAGSLTGTVTTSTTAVDLNVVGVTDWIHYYSTVNRKVGKTSISNFSRIGAGATQYTSTIGRPLSWTNGTPTTSSTNNKNALKVVGVGNGFSFTVPAHTLTSTLNVYVSGFTSTGRLTATLSDGSAAAYVNSQSAASGAYMANYTLTFKANSPGQTLTVKWELTAGTGNVCLSGAAYNVSDSSADTKNYIGINTNFSHQEGSRDRMFADDAKTPFSYGSLTATPLVKDQYGWPMSDFKVVMWEHDLINREGKYTLYFTGTCTNIIAVRSGGAVFTTPVYTAATNTTTSTITLTSSGSFEFKVVGTNGGVKNLKLMRPITPGSLTSYAPDVTFTDQFKNLIKKFKVVRFMDYFFINSNPIVNWADRTTPNHAVQDRKMLDEDGVSRSTGGSYEYAIQLCNETNTDLWLNIPINASDNYIDNLAALVKSSLNPWLKVYVEFGNEVWNYGLGGLSQSFRNYYWNRTRCSAEVAAGGSPLNYDGSTDLATWSYRRVAKRTVEISNQFRTVFGNSAMHTRIRPVFMSQVGNRGAQLYNGLKFMENYYNVQTGNPINYYIYGAGGAGYYGQGSTPPTTVDDFWTLGTNVPSVWGLSTSQGGYGHIDDAKMVHSYGLKRIAYEGGLEHQASTDAAKALRLEIFNDPRMKQLLIDHQNYWSSLGGDLFVFFESTAPDPVWAFTTNINDLNTHKLNAAVQLIGENRAPITNYSAAPVTFAGSAYTDKQGNTYGQEMRLATATAESGWLSYVFRVSTAGTYNVSVKMLAARGGTLQIVLDGIVRGTEVIAGGATSPTYTMANLQPGVHSVRIKNVGTAACTPEFVYINTGAGVKVKEVTTAVDELSFAKAVTIYPNPANEFVNIYMSEPKSTTKVTISDLSGRVVYNSNTRSENGLITINSSRFTKGLYVVTVNDGTKTYTEKLNISK